ncbi:hypothetical protein AGMMS50293_16550 [Spirochaetia bacterium]|nr:hypothetical protein AGMMS50293_16550 [Spirochaetia bacterium]
MGVFLAFSSCAAQIRGPLNADGSADLQIRASLEPRMAALIRSLSAVATGPAMDGPLLDGPAIAQSMSNAPGISSVSFSNTAPAAIEGPVRVSQIGDFLAAGGSAPGGSTSGSSGFISFEQSSGRGRCSIGLSRETGPEILSLLSPEISEYLSVLMAPLATGEQISKAEYLELVSTVFGKALADEISRSTIRVSIDFPGAIQSVRGGTFSGRRAEFTVPLPDLLVLETPLSYEVIWK